MTCISVGRYLYGFTNLQGTIFTDQGIARLDYIKCNISYSMNHLDLVIQPPHICL